MSILFNCGLLFGYSELSEDLKQVGVEFLNHVDLNNLAQCSSELKEIIKLHKVNSDDYIPFDKNFLPLKELYTIKDFLRTLSEDKKLHVLVQVCYYFFILNPKFNDRNAKNDFIQFLAEIYHVAGKVTYDVLNQHLQRQAVPCDMESGNFALARMQSMLNEELQRNRARLRPSLDSAKSESELLKIINDHRYEWPRPFKLQLLHQKSEWHLKSQVKRRLNEKMLSSPNIWSLLPEIYNDAEALMLDEVLAHAYQHLSKKYKGPEPKKGIVNKILGSFFLLKH